MSWRRAWFAAVWTGLITALVCPPAAASSPGDELHAVGLLAKGRGLYGFAIQAHKQAALVSGDPEQYFRVADAYDQRFLKSKDPRDAARAQAYMQRYLGLAPKGKRAAEARAALPRLRKALQENPVDPARFAAYREREAKGTRLVVRAAQLEAVVRVDGAPAVAAPLLAELKPGKHRVEVRASGYEPEARDVELVEGTLYPLMFDLRPTPGKLAVTAPSGATVRVDGTMVGVAPLEDPVDTPPGPRQVVVTLNGHLPFSTSIDVARGEEAEVNVDLTTTTQRKWAYGLLSVGAAGLIAGIGSGVASVLEHRTLSDARSPEELQSKIDRRDDLRVVSGTTAGIGFGLFLIGGGLYVLDEPKLTF